VNCVALLHSQIDERNPESVRLAERVNTDFPLQLAIVAAEAGASVLHVSTDAVFPPDAGRCGERTPPAPANAYARTKLHGEIVADNVLSLRCSLVGPDPWHSRGLIEWLRSRPPGSRVPGFTNQRWVGATTFQVAELCRVLIAEGLFEKAVREGPVHHFCPCEPVSKYELLRQVAAALNLDVEVQPVVSEQPVTRQLDTDYQVIAAAFPKYGRLDAALAALAPRPHAA
jgi:dTDP-4-dehydrorhamnose reductase